MKSIFTFIGLFLCLSALAADINITNVTKANAVPAGSYVLGTTGLVTRLLPTSLLGDGSQVWTNASGTVMPLSVTHLNLGTNDPLTSSRNFNILASYRLSEASPMILVDAGASNSMNEVNGLYVSVANPDDATFGEGLGKIGDAIVGNMNLTNDVTDISMSSFFGANNGLRGVQGNATSGTYVGAGFFAGVWGNTTADGLWNIGALGTSKCYDAGVNSIGIAGVAMSNNNQNTNVGGYFGSFNTQIAVSFESAAVLADTFNGAPIFVGRSNGVPVLKVSNTGTLRLSGSTNAFVLPCPDGGSFILTVKNDGTLNVITNTGGL